MEVDRISQMGGVGHDASPAWQRSARRRRKFSEEVDEPQPDDGLLAEDEALASGSDPNPQADDPSPDPDSIASDDAAQGANFRAIA